MKKNLYFFLVIVLSFSTLLGTAGNSFALIQASIADTLKTKEVSGKLVDTRANKPKDNLIIFKPFAPYTPYLKATNTEKTNTENIKTISNVKVFPNPVSGQINLSFKLSKDINVSIKIMDALGNEINTLLSQRLAEGDQTHTFNLNSSLKSGFYFIRIMAGTETVVKRIQIL
ncbi:T9SS type A sorting domain-containing protein [Albibacterium bauzanense]|uniref:Putative secreted protein (Por secretion system target) n=1 Tax=Albibacterium bauzanense TaxID=653929 RepID=A0A4R1LR58_9SPHI|nr:T9SS type A sorting domain-containing protein [Albibacterium bauzanense]TCK80987.1 putative secreted protein (Por secretion system target) [Albibacterium bauzanense]